MEVIIFKYFWYDSWKETVFNWHLTLVKEHSRLWNVYAEKNFEVPKYEKYLRFGCQLFFSHTATKTLIIPPTPEPVEGLKKP